MIIAVAIFHLVYTWNLYFEPLLYLSSSPSSSRSPRPRRVQQHLRQQPQLIQAATLMTIVIPMIIFFIAQRAFMRGIVITGVEK